jgi:anthranilate synthase/aminodeoxychorismate synthase-like glutamine amidotransferase
VILLLDNFDSFTYNLVDYFAQLDIDCHVVRNNIVFEEIIQLNPTGLVISPGPEVPKKAGCLMDVLAYFENKIPILGICLGHQAIGEHFGWELVKAPVPRHGKVTRITHTDDVLFNGIPTEFNAVQYNSLILNPGDLSLLNVIATGNGDQVMGIKHKILPIWGLQFHPEAALTEYGLIMLKNWLECNKLTY